MNNSKACSITQPLSSLANQPIAHSPTPPTAEHVGGAGSCAGAAAISPSGGLHSDHVPGGAGQWHGVSGAAEGVRHGSAAAG